MVQKIKTRGEGYTDEKDEKVVQQIAEKLTEKQKEKIMKVGKVSTIFTIIHFCILGVLLAYVAISLFVLSDEPLAFTDEVFKGFELYLAIILGYTVLGSCAIIGGRKIACSYYDDDVYKYLKNIRK